MEHLMLSIGVGLFVSLLFAEFFGLAAGGMIVPGYFALYLTNPLAAIVTVLLALATFGLVRLASTMVIIYGKRRTVLMILVGYLLSMFLRGFAPDWLLTLGGTEIQVIGFIIPGLIAIWLDRQGLVETLSTLVIASVAVRLGLIIILGEDLRS